MLMDDFRSFILVRKLVCCVLFLYLLRLHCKIGTFLTTVSVKQEVYSSEVRLGARVYFMLCYTVFTRWSDFYGWQYSVQMCVRFIDVFIQMYLFKCQKSTSGLSQKTLPSVLHNSLWIQLVYIKPALSVSLECCCSASSWVKHPLPYLPPLHYCRICTNYTFDLMDWNLQENPNVLCYIWVRQIRTHASR